MSRRSRCGSCTCSPDGGLAEGDDDLAEMTGRLLMGIGRLGVVEAEYAVDRRLELGERDRPVHVGEHLARADVDALQADAFAVDHARVDRACAGERADDVDGAARTEI